MKNNDVIHAWAQGDNRTLKGYGVIKCENNILYSYDTIIGYIQHVGEKTFAFLNTSKYSITTTGHQSQAKHSLPYRYKVIELEKEIFIYVLEQERESYILTCLLGKLRMFDNRKNTKSTRHELKTLLSTVENLLFYFKALGNIETCLDNWKVLIKEINFYIDGKFNDLKKTSKEFTEKTKSRLEAKAKELAEKERIVEAEAIKKKEEFLQYKIDRCYTAKEKYIRLSKNKQSVETSAGLSIPLKTAKALFRFVMRIDTKGGSLKLTDRNIKVKDYRLDKIKPNKDIIVSCHYIKYDDMQHIYSQLQTF